MARNNKMPAKRANRMNPRQDRNYGDNVLDFASTTQHYNKRQYHQRTEPCSPFAQIKGKRVELLPRNLAQEAYIEALQDETHSIVFAMGPAGTGKTLLATQYAISQLHEGKVQKIIITRPAVSVDEDWGALPGDIIAKASPWMRPIVDIFAEFYPIGTVKRMMEEEIFEVAPLAFMRGRTLKNAIVIGDEMQNATASQAQMLLTRLGEGSRMFITGDLQQHDRGFENNGLKDFVTKLRRNGGSNMFAVCEFSICDVERHPAVAEVLRIYGNN